MRKLLMTILIPVVIIVGIPAIILGVVYDDAGDVDMPTYLYTDEYSASEMLFTELDESIDDVENNPGSDMYFNLTEDMINRAIYEAILENNPEYAPGDDCTTDEECYIYSGEQDVEGESLGYRVVGFWVDLSDESSEIDKGSLVLNTYLEVKFNNFSYKTVIKLNFLFEDNQDYYKLEFEKINLGQMPVPKSLISTVVNTIDDQAGLDLEQMVGELPIGNFNLDDISYVVQKDELLEQLESGDETDAVARLSQELLAINFDKRLVVFEVEEGELVVQVGISMLSNDVDVDIPEYLYDLHDQTIVNDEVVYGEYNPDLYDQEGQLQNIFTDFLFNSTLFEEGFVIHEEAFNQMVYASQNGFTEMRSSKEIPISDTETKVIEFGLKAIWFEVEEDHINIHSLFQIGEVDSMLVIRADQVSVSNEELIFEFTNISVGKDEGETNLEYLEIDDLQTFREVFADFGDVEIGEFNEEGNLIITAEKLSQMLQDGSSQGAVEVNSVDLTTDGIILGVTAGEGLDQILSDFQAELQGALETNELLNNLDNVLDVTNGGADQDIYDSIQNIQDDLLNGEDVSSEDLGTFIDGLIDLDESTQSDVIEAFTSIIDGDTLDAFEAYFGSLTD